MLEMILSGHSLSVNFFLRFHYERFKMFPHGYS